MSKGTFDPEPQEVLSGWKSIANFLGRGVRTVQRYELELGLPVRRPSGHQRGSVIALKAELEGWVKAGAMRDVFLLKRSERLKVQPVPRVFHEHLAEMVTLRQQMAMLQAEVTTSMKRLQESLSKVQGALTSTREAQHPYLQPSSLYSQNERDVLDRTAEDFLAPPAKTNRVA